MKTVSEYIAELHNFTNNINFARLTPQEGKKFIKYIGRFCDTKMAPAFIIKYPVSNATFTRAVSYKGVNGSYEKLEELWSPQAKLVKYPGRVNFRKRSILYCAENEAVALFDNKPKSITRFAVLKFRITHEMNLMSFGLRTKYKDYKTQNFTNKEIALDKYFAQKFIEEIKSDESSKYLQTAIITNLFYPNNIDGFVYPSAASNFKGENIAIKNDFALKYHEIQ